MLSLSTSEASCNGACPPCAAEVLLSTAPLTAQGC